MLLPRGDEYNIAVQNPGFSFNDADLKNCSVETTPLGLPKPYSGGFTITYKLKNNRTGWAVRCFHRDIQDLQRRYQAIGLFLTKTHSQYFVDAKYLSDGIKVNGKDYPIIKMLWLEGEPLNNYIDREYNQKAKIEKILVDFVNLISELEKFGIAHGDLQHGNIIVKNEKLFLIDYDGMYFPELASLKTNEIGHVNYQHPKRSASHFNQYIDRFSSIIIYLGLKAISLNFNLWKKYDNSENLLFKSKDFADLQYSPLIKDLLAIPEMQVLVERLIGCCHLDFEKIPSLKDFLSGNFTYNKSNVGRISISRNQYLILDAKNSGSIMEHFGEKIEVVGRIDAVKSDKTKFFAPYTFLNFGIWPNQTFTLVMWQDGITSLAIRGTKPSSLVGKWISVTGVISSYGNKPQMIIEVANQIQILANEEEANERLKMKPSPIPDPIITTAKKGVIDKETEVFNTLYGNRPVSKPLKDHINNVTSKNTTNFVAPKQTSQSTISSNTSSSQTNKQTTKQSPNQKTSSKKGSGNSGCVVLIIFSIIGALAVGLVLNENMWLAGALGGGYLVNWLEDFLKS